MSSARSSHPWEPTGTETPEPPMTRLRLQAGECVVCMSHQEILPRLAGEVFFPNQSIYQSIGFPETDREMTSFSPA